MIEEDFPANLIEFEERFGSEEACRSYLFRLRWPEGFRCPACGHSAGWANCRHDIQCSQCGRQTSLTAGTILEGTRKPLRFWFLAIWWVSTQKTGGSAKGLQRLLGLKSYQTAWTWLQKLRRAMVRAGRDRLAGVVEVDDGYLGGAEQGVFGRESSTKARLAVAVELSGRKIGRIRLRHVPDLTAESLVRFVEESVEPGSEVRTDGWRSYETLAGRGYRHRVKIIGPNRARATRLMPSVHRVIALLKRWLIGTHHGRVGHRHLQAYLDEFAFRFNRRKSRHVGKIFFRLIQQGAQTKPVAYRALVAASRKRKHKILGLHD
jgi:transposase-like protein